ncbi:protein phosphatase 2C domain-containing protein [Xanthomonas sp. 3075]|uniref:protein phosphatase 2C domain-containing protein n=1 Tax=Xanthomonas sp. 3075 TaxID=3035315 RepID=UPI00161831AE|nr:protein phosphatase 2C domain-containing protein [Xanthomonas sp. 3075]MBB4129808.1 serine/threonine protein phosphatase PrpC [Xanthomonas sp. 3075]
MSPLPPPAPPAHVQAQAALAEVLGSYLRQHGVAPEPALLRQLLQEAPVLELLHWLDATVLRLAPPLAAALASTPPPAPSATAEAQIATVPSQAVQTQVESITLGKNAPAGPASAPGVAADALFVAPATTAPTTTALRWRFANATAGTPYRAQATPVSDPQRPQLQYRLMAVDGLQGSGLRFDAADGVLSGVPSTATATGEEMHFAARFVPVDAAGDAPVHAGVASLLVNPDPRALWKQREPDAALGLRKPHTATAHAQIAGAQVVAASVRGRSHANAASFREDDFAIATDRDARWLVCAVADGAGSAPLSRRGSELLTRHAVTTLAAHMDGIECWAHGQALQWQQHAEVLPRVQPRLAQAVCASLVSASQALVQHATLLGVDESALAATLMLTAVRPCGEQLLVLNYWIGDGAAAAYDAATGQVQLLGHADAGEYSGQTRFFLSDALAGDPQAAVQARLRCVWLPAGAKVILMSDGVSDPKFGTERALQDPAQWQHWWQTDIAPQLHVEQGSARCLDALVDYLGFWCPGEHDDRTLLMIQTERVQ